MNYMINAIGRKGLLVLVVFATVSAVELLSDAGASPHFLDFSLWISGIFAGGNAMEHFAKTLKKG